MCLRESSTDLCVLKVIIYRVLQLPQFLLLFLLLLLLLLRQSGLSLVIVLVVLLFLWCNKTKRGVKRSARRGIRPQGSPRQPACHRHWSSRSFVLFFYVGDTCFWLLLTCTAPNDNNQGVYHFTFSNTQIMFILSACPALSVFFRSLGISFRHACAVQPESVEALHASFR